MGNPDACKDDEVVGGRPCLLPTKTIYGRHIDIAYCHMAQYPKAPNISDQASNLENCIAQWETFVCKKEKKKIANEILMLKIYSHIIGMIIYTRKFSQGCKELLFCEDLATLLFSIQSQLTAIGILHFNEESSQICN